MKQLTPAEKKQLDKDLERVLKAKEDALEAVKRDVEATEKAAKDYFSEFADYYNAARDYYYDKLDAAHRRRGDFRTMEVTAQVSEKLELILTGVWGARCLTVKRVFDGFEATMGDGVTKKKLSTRDELWALIMSELFDDHPLVREINEKLYLRNKLLKEIRGKAGLE